MSKQDGSAARTGLASAWSTIALIAMGVIGAAVIAALIWIQVTANRERDRALALQTHSYEVMILARSLSGTIARSEASLGRYVISGDKQLGQLYYEQWQMAGSQLDRLDTMIGPRTAQQLRIDALRSAYRARGDELSVVALSTAYHKNEQALGRYYQARRSRSLTQIEGLLAGLFAGERQTLDVRRAAALASVAHSSQIAGSLAVFGVALVIAGIVLGTVTLKAQADRATARADADAERERAAELQAAVAAATDELRAQESKLRQIQKMEAVGQLTGGIAHDFNNMLAVVLGGLELARRHADEVPFAVRRHLDGAMEGAERAAALTRRLLAFSREESLRPEPLDAGRVLAGMRDLLDRTLGDGITVSMADASRGWLLLADRIALENALLNLAVNARDAMDGRGVLTISTGAVRLSAQEVGHCTAGEHVTLSVSDTGCGMSPEVVERVFEPFFTTKPVGKGTGLGLSQIFALVRQLGGEIGIRSAPGAGTTVTLYLPRHDAAASLPRSFTASPPLPDAVPMPAGLVVLVVEDDPRVLAATSGALEELGHQAIGCNDPLAAPGLLTVHSGVDLIISDVLMPGQTGPEMIAGIADRFPDLPVLFVTGFAGQAGADDFAGRHVLRKPYTLAGLERAIGEAMADRLALPEQIAAE